MMKPFTKQEKTKKWPAMLVLALLCFSVVPLRAQTWSPNGNGNANYTIRTAYNWGQQGFSVNNNGFYTEIGNVTLNNANATVNIEFATTAPVYINGTITCQKGTINIRYGQGTTYPVPTLIRSGSNNMTNEANAFIRTDLGNNNPNNIHVNIQGTPEHPFVLDGNCSMRLVEAADPYGNGRPFYEFAKTSGSNSIGAPIILVQGGYVNLDYVTIRNHWKNTGGGGGITIKGNNNQLQSYVSVDHGLFEWLRAVDHGGAIYLNSKSRSTSGSNFELKNSEIRNCYVFYNHPYDYSDNGVLTLAGGGGGGIRSMGENRCEMTIDNCSIHDCYTNCDGGGIRWNSVLIRPLEIKNGTEVYNNWAYRCGGGMRVDALAEVEGCTFDNNRADYGGGGISLGVFNSGKQDHLDANNGRWDPSDGILTLDANTVISNNWAGENGGGLHFECDFIEFTQVTNPRVRFYRHANGEYFKVQLNVNGATIRDNTAEMDGGGVYMNRTTNFYGLEAHLNFGNIENNTAKGNGGGLALTEELDPNYTVRPGQSYYDPSLGITWYDIVAQPIQARVGSMKQSWQNELLTMKSNKAINGGGIYIDGGDIVMVKGLVSENEATGTSEKAGGGGYYVKGGTVAVNGGTISENIAQRDGGGFYVDVMDEVVITNDSTSTIISNNEAARGAGCFVNSGQLTIKQAEIEDSETSIIDNHAINRFGGGQGGGIYVQSGSFSLLNGSIGKEGHPNISDRTGGGAYVNSGDFYIRDGSLSYNFGTGGGGGAYVLRGTVDISGGSVSYNYTSETNQNAYGGGIWANGSGTSEEITISVKSTTFIENTARGLGGGIYALGTNTVVTVDKNDVEGARDALFEGNTANNGGGIYAQAKSVTIGNATFSGNKANKTNNSDGGGIFVQGPVTLNANTTLIKNIANRRGGAVYVNNGLFTMNDGVTIGGSEENANKTLSTNNDTGGGGIYVTGNQSQVDVLGGEISYNTAARNGGGLYVSTGSGADNGTNLSGIVLVANNKAATSGDGTSTINGNGGGAYVQSGSLNLTGAGIIVSENEAKNGGGLYMQNGSVNITSSFILDNTANNGNGGGIYLGNSTAGGITLSGAIISGNTATSTQNNTGQGGGIYTGAGTILVKDNTQIGTYSTAKATAGSGNTAKQGGGLYVNGGNVTFNGGVFAENSASTEGGGIYIKEGAILNMSDVAEIKDNFVPADGFGGGVYMNGTFNVGGGGINDKQTLKAYTNYAGESYSEATQNNVYLPSNSKYITLKSDISAQTDDHTYITKIGITTSPSQPHPHPVIYVEDVDTQEEWLYKLMDRISAGNGAVFDDTENHVAIHTRENYPTQGFETQYLYFDGCWTTAVNKDPQENLTQYPLPDGVDRHYTIDADGWHIYTPEGLAWFISYVNNLNGCTGDNRGTNAFIEADIDMSANRWVPIGAITSYDVASSTFAESDTQGDHYYTGTFDGQGYLVTGIKNGFLSGISLYGMFGATQGTLKNIFLDNYSNVAANLAANHDYTYYMGGVAGTANGGTISNCEARGTMESDNWQNTVMGGLVGMVDGNDVHVHSSMAMPILSGKAHTMGGLVGEMNAGDLKNSFSNASFTPSNNGVKVGGLVGINSGAVENCYIRLQGTEPDQFGWFAGQNSGTIDICYAPDGETDYVPNGNDPTNTGNYGATALVSGKYGFAHSDQQITGGNDDYVVNGAVDNEGELKGLLATLNKWVEQNDGYSTWTRTMASPMNDDYPILKFDDFVSAGTKDNIYLIYRADLNDMIGLVNQSNLETSMGLMNGNTTGGSIYLYGNNPTMVSTNTGTDVRVYIAPNTGILQSDDNTLAARVGVAFDNSDAGWLGGAPYDWHMFSSALEAAPMGLVYHSTEGTYSVRDNYSSLVANGIPHDNWSDVTYMDPPKTTWSQTETTPGTSIGYFPTDSPYGKWRGTPDNTGSFDFYFYSEEYSHWINFKREGKSGFYDHWHQNETADEMHLNIPYDNEEKMEVGKGYLMAVSEPSILMADGVLNTGNVSAQVSRTQLYGYEEPLMGVNMVGNPYQSYLDVDVFLTQNGLNTYYILDADAEGYIARVAGGSTPDNPEDFVVNYNAPQYLHPHQAFFVRVQNSNPLTFNKDMRNVTANSAFRQEAPHYAMVNMICSDAQGRNDIATIELDRPEMGGGEKIKGLRSGDANIWFSLGEQDLQVAFAPVGTSSAPLRFKAYNDGVYTLRWNMANADFHYMHLIDNITGANIDCLTASEYVFEGKTTDYSSRFRLVFDFTGVEENEDASSASQENFAFQSGDEVVVNGEGVLEVFDINGHRVMGCEILNGQSRVALPTVANGMYVLRLTDAKQVKVQKMVINK